jgi:hypothetical protein
MSLPIATVPMSEQSNLPKVLVPAGTHFARIFKIIDLGSQKDEYMGVDRGFKRVFSISFEFPKITHIFKEEKGKQPLARSKDFKFSFTSKDSTVKSALTELVEAVGDDPYKGGYNIFSLLGKPLQVKVEHKLDKNEIERDRISGFSKLSDEQQEMADLKPEIYSQVNDSQYLYLELSSFDQEIFDNLPKWIKEKIESSKEYQELNKTLKPVLNTDEDLPEIDIDQISVDVPF